MTHPLSTLDWRGGGDPGQADLVIRRAMVLDPRAGIGGVRDVVVRSGRLAELTEPGEGNAVDGEVVEAEGLTVLPAFFDPHVHLRTPGREDEEDLETGTRAAAAGGYCGIVAMANTEPPVDDAGALGALRERAREEAVIPIGFVACVTRGMGGRGLTEMAELAAVGAVAFSDDGLPLRNPLVLRRALQYQQLAGLPIALHEEDPDLSADGVMHEGAVSAAVGMAGIPSVSESTAIARDAALALYEGAQIHVQHLSAMESVAAVEAARAVGAEVTCEVTPHHLTLTDEEVRSLDSRFKMNPPLRTESDRQALVDALRRGTIDCIATDHAPHAAEEKEVPFEQAAMGVIGLETAFAVLYTELVLPGSLELGTLVDRLSAGAGTLGFDRPSLEPGSEANLVLVDTRSEWEAGEDGWESRSQNSPFTGLRLRGRILMTLAGGRVAYRQRSFAMGVAG